MYQLEIGSKKYQCPECNKKTWVKYIDPENGNAYLPEKYGRCDRESKCGFKLNPYNDHYSTNPGSNYQQPKVWKPPKKQSPVFMPEQALEVTFEPEGYQINTFLQNLTERVPFPFDPADVEQIINQYYLGTITAGYRAGAVTFPFIDLDKNIRTVQIKQFNEFNHSTGTDFLHSIIKNQTGHKPDWLEPYLKNETYVSCLFGEHLLNDYPMNPVALVEAPKTAIYGTLYYGSPEYSGNLIWLAVYNLSSLNFEKCKALKNRNVFLFPDLSKDGSAFRLWSDKAKSLTRQVQGSTFQVSTLLEQYATEEARVKGMDFADFLIELDWREFRSKEPLPAALVSVEPEELKISVKSAKGAGQTNIIKNIAEAVDQITQWESDLSELQEFFKWQPLPKSAKIDIMTKITDVDLFVSASFSLLRANSGKAAYLPYLERLKLLKYTLSEGLVNGNSMKTV